ncbi:MAG: PDZ domain-containing protein [Oscillospiraceae bacterium]
MRIEAVTAGGPAEKAGLLTGDIITEVEGEKTLDLGMTGRAQRCAARREPS